MLKFRVRTTGIDELSKKISNTAPKAAHIVAQQAAKDTAPFVPMRTGSLDQRTVVEGASIIYPGPYARYLYYGKVMVGPKYGPKEPTDKDLVFSTAVHSQAQSHWFEASKAQNLEKWERVADKAVKKELGK